MAAGRLPRPPGTFGQTAHPWLSPKDMGPDVVVAIQDKITDAAMSGSCVKLVPPRSVAVVVRSGILERKMPVAVVPGATTLNQDMKALQPREGVDPRWVAWGLRAKERQILDRCRKAGTTVASLDTSRLMAEELPVPPFAQQVRIVDLLEEHLSRLDAADESLLAAAKRIEALESSVLEGMWTRSARHPSAAWAAIEDLVDPSRRLAYGVLVPGPHVDGGVPLVRVGDLAGVGGVAENLKRISTDIDSKFPRTRLRGGEVLISVVGTIGRTAVVPAALAGANVARAVAVLPPRIGLHSHYLALLLTSPSASRALNRLAHEVARKTLNLEDVRRFRLPIIPLEDQEACVNEHVELSAKWRRLRSDQAAAVSGGKGLRQSLLSAAFAGHLSRAASGPRRAHG